MKNYMVVSDSDLGRLEDRVNALLDLGFVLIGGVSVISDQHAALVMQAMAQPIDSI